MRGTIGREAQSHAIEISPDTGLAVKRRRAPQRKVTDTLRRFLNGGLIVRKHNGFELTDKGKGTIAANEEKARMSMPVPSPCNET
jgi:predicted methyltransferase